MKQGAPEIEPTATAARRGVGIGLVALVGASLLLRLPGMLESIWYDEFFRTLHVLGNPERRDWLLWRDVHGFVYNGFMYFWVRAFGDAEWVIRLPSLLAGYGSLGLFCWWARQRFGAAAAGLVGAWALVSPVHVWYSTEAKNNAFALLFATCILISYDRLAERRTARWAALAAAAGTVGLWQDFVVALTLAPVWGAWAWLAWTGRTRVGASAAAPRRDWELLRLLAAAGGVAAVLGGAWLGFKAGHLSELHRLHVKDLDVQRLVTLLCSWFTSGNAIVPADGHIWKFSLASAVVFAPVLGLGVAGAARRRGGWAVVAMLAAPVLFFWAVPPLLRVVTGGAATDFVMYQERNLVPVLYAYGLVMVLGALSLRRVWLRGAALGVVFAYACAGTGLMLTVHARERTVMAANADWRGVGAAVRRVWAETGEAGGPLVLTKGPAQPLPYYCPEAEVVRLPVALGDELRMGAVRREARSRGVRRFVFVDDGEWDPLSAAELERLGRVFRIERREVVGRVGVYVVGVRGRGGG